MIKTYVPSLFLMTVGFSSFWISLDASNERLSLSTTILLALYTQLGAIKNFIPNLSYLTVSQQAIKVTLDISLTSDHIGIIC